MAKVTNFLNCDSNGSMQENWYPMLMKYQDFYVSPVLSLCFLNLKKMIDFLDK